MSRMGSEAQRRMHSPEFKISPQREGIGTSVRPGWGRGWDFWVVRAFLLACTGAVSYTLGPFGLRGLQAGGVGILIGLVVLFAELRLRRAALSGLLGGAFGAVLGVFAALLVTLVISRTDEPEPTKSFLEFAALFGFGYLGLVLGSGRGGELQVDALDGFFGKRSTPAESMKLLDTSVLIDGRIAEICEAQFMEGVLGVPQFVLHVNQLAQALKPAVLPGEPMRVLILREGKEQNQGVAYLDDGTMVVVDGARRLINRSVDIIVTSVHQTTAGKMIFGRLEERAEQAAPAVRHAAAGRGESNGVVRSETTGSRSATSTRLQEQGTLERQARAILPEPDAG